MTQPAELLQWIEQLNRARVLVMGDIMLDRFVSGDVSRISPEGPVPVLRCDDSRSALGGAGNVARNIGALGAQTYIISAIGMDDEGEQIERLLIESHAIEPVLIKELGRKTTVKTRFLAQQQQLLRVDTETVQPIEEGSFLAAIKALHLFMPKCDVLILSDYGKGFLTPNLIREAIDFCRISGKTVLIDPKGSDYGIYRNAHIITPNLKELGEAARMPVKGDSAVILAAMHLIETCGIKTVLATRSQEGMSLIEASGKATHFRSEAKEVYDVTGAGDTAIAVLSAAIAAGAPLEQSAEISNIAAGIVVGKVGTAVTDTADLVQAVRCRELTTAESKVLDLRAAIDKVELWRRKGNRIGFVSGFFELLHPAHIRLLARASKACDRLIVGINSDASVYRLKGSMPTLHETARSSIIASLEDVDMVVIFQGDSPAQLLEVLHPDVHIVGANGIPDVANEDGRTLLVDLQDDFSMHGINLESISVGML